MRNTIAVLTLASTLVAPFCAAVDRLNLSVGRLTRPNAVGFPDTVQVDAGWNLPWQWFDTDTGVLQTRAEAGVTYNRTHVGPVWSVEAAPILHYQYKADLKGCSPFIDGGVGVGALSETRWGTHWNLTTHWQFASRIGAGCRFGTNELSLNFFHYSNAGLKKPNPGADMVYVRYSFDL
ncbi:acyloxyacyl hydrolase [Andreprevotia chitinilytica]|uniref:acyloxyacyl hydrolase n=1 Tax=Andreprevotia chitinilytica TaxID=396808 RepID=UPI0006900A37|nr:acyloxyacyl hydrolase [Andreprevotia chitinilytica]